MMGKRLMETELLLSRQQVSSEPSLALSRVI
jgi:hypothetical protein